MVLPAGRGKTRRGGTWPSGVKTSLWFPGSFCWNKKEEAVQREHLFVCQAWKKELGACHGQRLTINCANKVTNKTLEFQRNFRVLFVT